MQSTDQELSAADIEALITAAEAVCEAEGVGVESPWGITLPGGALALLALERLPEAGRPDQEAVAALWRARKRALLGREVGRIGRSQGGPWRCEPSAEKST